jgi:Flp pilus assembly protein CpaB
MTTLDSRGRVESAGRSAQPSGGLPGVGSLSRSVSKTPRKYGQMLLSFAVVIAAVVAGGWLYANKGGVQEVLVVAEAIPAGHPITESDVRTSTKPLLVSRSVSGVEGAIPVSEVDSVFGKRTTVSLLPGQVLTQESLTSELLPQDGQRLIAVSISAGRVPETLEPGSVVDAVAVPQEGQSGDAAALDDPQVISAGATVYSAKAAQDGSVVVTLLISESDARPVAAYGAVSQLTLLQAPVTDGDSSSPSGGED